MYSQMRTMYGHTLDEFRDAATGRPETTPIKLFPSPVFAYAAGRSYAEQLGIPLPENVEQLNDTKHPFHIFMTTQFRQLTKDSYDPNRVFTP
jgi:hypothetical protein